MPFPSRYGPVMNVVLALIESDDEFPSARIKSVKNQTSRSEGFSTARKEII